MTASTGTFDVSTAALSGLHLIEASAGTGKTFTIAALYERLVIESGLAVEGILVVTFTKAATAELRTRIRDTLSNARARLVARGDRKPDGTGELHLQRLTRALRSFDQAAIFTIHSFCQKVLTEQAFESAMPFENEFATEQNDVLQDIVDDFWRIESQALTPVYARWLLDRGISPDTLLRWIRPCTAKPWMNVVAPAVSVDSAAAESAFTQAFEQARQIWLTGKDDIARLIIDSTSLNGNRYRAASRKKWLQEIGDWLESPSSPPGGCEALLKFTRACLDDSLKKGCDPVPAHAFFTACDALWQTEQRLLAGFADQLAAMIKRLLAYANDALQQKQQREHTLSFDDLLLNLQRALASADGTRLAAALRQRYPAALIDEFQDTDPVQYDIFRAIYAAGAGSGEGAAPVFLVGDPKQAIYSFRGADVFAYLAAREDTRQRHSLAFNWRSVPALIDAVNSVFLRAQRPFVMADIPFQPVQAAAHSIEKPLPQLLENGQPLVPLQFWLVEREAGVNRPLAKAVAQRSIARATAAEISRLLRTSDAGQLTLGDAPLAGADIAVLVRTHKQGVLISDVLRELGIASVSLSRGSVFESDEALELEQLLHAIAEPRRETLLRTALATRLLGKTAAELQQLIDDEQMWLAQIDDFYRWRSLWQAHGFIRMFQTVLSDRDVEQGLLALPDGERRLTNLLQLAQLLQARVQSHHDSMEGLIKWLAARRHLADPNSEEQQLQLESDEQLVRIVTVHKSKGLQYPIVFCPFLWDVMRPPQAIEPFTFHDPDNDFVLTMNCGGSADGNPTVERDRRQFEVEELAENLRLAYVALTRARNRCYLSWGRIGNHCARSSLAWLFHQPADNNGDPTDAREQLLAYFKDLSDADLYADLETLRSQAEDAIAIDRLPGEPGVVWQAPTADQSLLQARSFSTVVRRAWRMTSFSALNRSGHPRLAQGDEQGGDAGSAPVIEQGAGTVQDQLDRPDHDAGTGRDIESAAGAGDIGMSAPRDGTGMDIFGFPRGARAGSCLHAILEHLDFQAGDSKERRRLVDGKLRAFGIESTWTPVILDMLDQVLATDLDGNGLTLSSLGHRQRVNEMAFCFPVADLGSRAFRDVLISAGFATDHGDAAERQRQIDALGFPSIDGFLTGFIDLVFEHDGRYWLADYKSNWLGSTLNDYRPDTLAVSMAQHGYYLQYLLYTIALHRYLGRRLPDYDYDRHIGGVLYLFLRGMRGEPANGGRTGIYFDRPARALIEALDACVGGGD